ncbi:MerR family transcriptional regulator [Nocardioides zeae]|uniref:MerR family transcriptional regulator n=1 Tax=Nocardioides imazamoxiresistens TaxID=3231893 RepID=A0ABU3PV30_9ACTN|nr:MerR family transcriptional regulator [Nocardioides zeae]MDT9593087.1 MerR family transcriptional regulator [Nocardioides zeae]
MKSSTWSIGDAAARFGLETHVLRHWEDEGLVTPGRDAGGRRRYAEPDVVRIAAIVRNKAAGMSLEQIRVLLDSDAPGRQALLQAHLDDIAERMRSMELWQEMTEHALRCRAHDVTNCPRYKAFLSDLLDTERPRPPLPPEAVEWRARPSDA